METMGSRKSRDSMGIKRNSGSRGVEEGLEQKSRESKESKSSRGTEGAKEGGEAEEAEEIA